MVFEARDGVARARRLEATDVPQKRRDRALVEADQEEEDAARPSLREQIEAAGPRAQSRQACLKHFFTLGAQACGRGATTPSARRARPSSPAPGLAMTTRSMPAGTRFGARRKHSRQRRLMRFRTTAPPVYAPPRRRVEPDLRAPRADEEDEMSRADGSAVLLHAHEIGATADAAIATEGESSTHIPPSGRTPRRSATSCRR